MMRTTTMDKPMTQAMMMTIRKMVSVLLIISGCLGTSVTRSVVVGIVDVVGGTVRNV
jgi:hypothetical protein